MIGCLLHSADFDMFYSSGCDGLFKAFCDCFLTHVCQLIFRVGTRIACCQQYFSLCPFLLDFLHSFLYSVFWMSTVVSIAVCRFCGISLNSLCVGLWLLCDGLPEFYELILDVAKASAVFNRQLSPLLIVTFLEFLVHRYDMADGRAYGLMCIGLFFLLDRFLRQDDLNFLQRLN